MATEARLPIPVLSESAVEMCMSQTFCSIFSGNCISHHLSLKPYLTSPIFFFFFLPEASNYLETGIITFSRSCFSSWKSWFFSFSCNVIFSGFIALSVHPKIFATILPYFYIDRATFLLLLLFSH